MEYLLHNFLVHIPLSSRNPTSGCKKTNRGISVCGAGGDRPPGLSIGDKSPLHSLTGLLDTSWGANLALLLRLPPLCPARFLSCDNPFTGGWGHCASFAGTD